MKLSQAILLNSCYSIFLRNWLKHFDKENIFLVNGNEMSKWFRTWHSLPLSVSNPGKVMLEVEDFIGVQKWYSQDNFVINPDTGYYCIKAKAEDAALQCLASSKVWSLMKLENFTPILGKTKRRVRSSYNWQVAWLLQAVQWRLGLLISEF